MSNFKVGEKVVCIETDPNTNGDGVFTFKDKDYLICGITSFGGLMFFGVVNFGNNWMGHNPNRFRKLDHQFSEDVIAEIIKQVKEEELTLSN